MRDLVGCLSDYSMPKLRALAAARRIVLSTSRRADAARELAAAMLSPESIGEALEMLSPQERHALEAVQAAGGRVRADPFVRRFGGLRPIGDGRLIVEQPWLSPQTPTERLWYLGLLFKEFAEYGGEPVEFFFIPTDVLALLPQPSAQAGIQFKPIAAPSESWESGGTAAVDACTLLALMQTHEVTYARGRGLSPGVAQIWHRRWRYAPPEPPPFEGYLDMRARLLLRLVAGMGLAQKSRGRIVPRAEGARPWLTLPREAQLQRMWESWAGDARWDELRQIPEIRCEGTGWSNDPILTRRRLLRLLEDCKPGEWYRLEDVVQTIRDEAPDFQRTGGDYNSWYIRDRATDQYLMGFEHWGSIEGRLIVRIVTGPMHWLGAAELGGGADGSVLAFRLTPLGADLLGGKALDDSTEQASLVVFDDGQVRWPVDGNLYHRFQVERFADWKGSDNGDLYQITPGSLSRVLAQGIRAESLVAFLERASGSELPDGLSARIQAWATRRGRARLRRAMLLETDAPETLAEILADPEIAPHLGEVLTPTSVAVAEDHWREVLARLRQRGYVS